VIDGLLFIKGYVEDCSVILYLLEPRLFTKHT